MEKEVIQLDKVTLLYYPCQKEVEKTIVITPSSAGYYAQKPDSWGHAKDHIDHFCTRLSEKYHIFYLILPGQDFGKDDLYSYKSSYDAVAEAIFHIIFLKCGDATLNLVGGIGMCTGGAILSDVCMNHLGLQEIPLILYSTAAWVGWSLPKLQDRFTMKYPLVRLDRNALLSAPQPGDIIADHKGPLLQLLVGSIDYPLGGKIGRGGQEELQNFNKNIQTRLFKEMSDVPIEGLEEYELMVQSIEQFFEH